MRFAANSPKVGANPVFFTKNGFFEFAGRQMPSVIRRGLLQRQGYDAYFMVKKSCCFIL